MPAGNFETHEINGLEDFILYLKDMPFNPKTLFLFRGQPLNKALIPGIARHHFIKSKKDDEERMLNEFSNQSFQYLNHRFQTQIEKLTIAQHHGLPTRLLDWTENALAALYFAVSNKVSDENQSVVWVMSINRESEILKVNPDDDLLKINKLKLFKPASIIPRVSSQFGWFSCHPYCGDGFYLRADKENEQYSLSRLYINKESINEILQLLEICGVYHHSLFRDLDSLGRYVFEKYRTNRGVL